MTTEDFQAACRAVLTDAQEHDEKGPEGMMRTAKRRFGIENPERILHDFARNELATVTPGVCAMTALIVGLHIGRAMAEEEAHA